MEPTEHIRRELPEAVKETIHPEEKIEICPVIHRTRETTEVRQIIEPRHRTEVLPTQVHHVVLPEKDIGELVQSE